MNVFLVVNGSNDLYYPIKKSIVEFLDKITELKDVDIYMIYSLIWSKEFYLWKNEDEKEIKYDNAVAIKKNGKYTLKKNIFFKKNNMSIDIEEFLLKYHSQSEENILIVTGHGGPFQSLLDMSVSPAKSLSTYKLCNIIKKFSFNLVFLDMCAMNYIEVLYELLKESKIEAVITYKNLAPFNGINYKKFIENAKLNTKAYVAILKENENFIYLDKSNLIKLDYIKELQNEMARKCFSDKQAVYDLEIVELNKTINDLVKISSLNNQIKAGDLKYIQYFLNDPIDRIIYNKYLFSKNNMWRKIVAPILEEKEIEYVNLGKDGLRNIIELHNYEKNNYQINKCIEEYIKIRDEKRFYESG